MSTKTKYASTPCLTTNRRIEYNTTWGLLAVDWSYDKAWWKTVWWWNSNPQDVSWKNVVQGSHSSIEKYCQDQWKRTVDTLWNN